MNKNFTSPVLRRIHFFVLVLTLLSLLLIATASTAAPTLPLPVASASKAPQEAARLNVPNAKSGDKLGRSVAMSADGLTILGGADQDEIAVNNTGYAAVFMYAGGGSWQQQKLDPCSGGASGDELGAASALSADGQYALVGAIKDDVNGNNNGAACVYVRSGGTWSAQTKLLPDDLAGQTNAQVGRSAALTSDGTMAIVGAWFADDGVVPNVGAAYVFTRTGTTWSQVAKLMPGDATPDNYGFGVSVALSGDDQTLIIGARQPDAGSGAAYAYTWDGSAWVFQQKLTASDGLQNDEFGKSVSLSADGTVALVGANADDNNGLTSSGSAYIFTRSGNVWTEQQKLTPVDPGSNEEFGFAVDLSDDGTRALITARWDGQTGVQGGAGYLFQQFNNTWLQTRKLVTGDGSAGDWVGASAALSGDAKRVALGATGAGGKRGILYLFSDLPFTGCDEILGVTGSECQALVDLYDSTTGAGWTDHTGWKTTNAVCSWYGVTCTDGHVTTLNLFSNGLNGSIPASIGNLTALTNLNLADNTLSGGIPAAIGSLTTLQELALSDNPLGGTLPDNLSSLTGLTKLNLDSADLTGAIPEGLWGLSGLLELDLTDNHLTGSIPAAVSGMTSLVDLRLGKNRLDGTLPPQLGSLSMLQRLYLNGNRFRGDVPSALTGLVSLSAGKFGYNLLTASDPAVSALLGSVDPDWDQTQTLPPADLVAAPFMDDVGVVGLEVSWTPIVYAADGGHYTVHCVGVDDAQLNTVDKTMSSVVISGLTAGDYTCSVTTTTFQHQHNQSSLTSDAVTVDVTYVGDSDTPVNDLGTKPLIFDGFPQQRYSFNISSATTATDPTPPHNDQDCPVSINPDTPAIHYELPGNAPGVSGHNGQVIIVRAGGPGWYRRSVLAAADTAIVIYEVNEDGSLGSIVACADDNAQGEVSVSSAKFNLDSSKTYHIAVWNEGAAPEGAIIEIGLANFDLVAPINDSIFPTDPPLQFTWKPYSGAQAYYFDIASTDLSAKLTLAERTPGADGDELVCLPTLCTLSVLPGSPLEAFMTEGNYLWSAAAKTADDLLHDSNQVYRMTLGSPALNLVVNGGMEIDLNSDRMPDGWQVKNASGDKQKCNSTFSTLISHSDQCAFMFKGSPAENSLLQQSIDGSSLVVGDTLVLSLWTKHKGLTSGLKAQLMIKYSDGSTDKIVTGSPAGTVVDYTGYSNEGLIEGTVSQLTLKLKFKSSTGKLWLDDVSISPVSGSWDRAADNTDLLGLPQSQYPLASSLIGR